MKYSTLFIVASSVALPFSAIAKNTQHSTHEAVPDSVIAQQRDNLASSTQGKGFGPQSPRDLNSVTGNNSVYFGVAPALTEMNLCDLHFHKNAEHSGGEFTKFAGNGNGEGFQSGYMYNGKLSKAELAPVGKDICPSEHSRLFPGDTIEVHYVYSSAKVTPAPTLDSCFSDAATNPQLRVNTQVYVVVNDKNALDFTKITELAMVDGLHQVPNLPNNVGEPIEYIGSTTGPGFNEVGSPFQATWSVSPKVAKVNIETVGKWCEGNVFNENHAHGVRNLVINPELLSTIN